MRISHPSRSTPSKRRLFCASCAVLLLSPSLHADDEQEFEFVDVRLINGPCCTDQGMDLVVDDDGSILIAGYRGSLDFDRDGEIDMPTFGSPDAFISKVSLEGSENTGWNRGPGGPKGDRADAIAPDRDGGVFVVGSFNDSMQMTDTTTLPGEGKSDGFVARYGRDSQFDWGRTIASPEADNFNDVASDSKGNVYAIGMIGGPVDVDQDGKVDAGAIGQTQALIVSYSPDGELRWMRSAGNIANSRAASIVTGPDDEIYIAGLYEKGAPDFDADGKPDLPVSEATSEEVIALRNASLYEWNGFYARLDEEGAPLWVNGISGSQVQVAMHLGVAANGDLLVLGGYTAEPDFDGDGTADLEYRSVPDRLHKYDLDANTFLMQVTPDGERVWTRRYTVPARHIVAGEHGILLSGTYSGVLDVDDDGILEREADDDDFREGYTMLLDERGDIKQVLPVVGRHRDIVNAAGFSPDGNTLYMTGSTSLGADFNGDGEIEAASMCHKAGELYLALFERKTSE